MPGPQRRHRAPQQPASAREILSDIFGSAFDFVSERVAEAAPRCELCDAIAVPLRCACGRFGCKTHGYFNFVLGKAICPNCAQHVGAPVMDDEDDDEDEPPPPPRPRRRARAEQQTRRGVKTPAPEATAIAWDVLGLDPATATEADVNKAFRQLARECHPDLHPGDETAKRKFQALRQSTDLCLADIYSRIGR